MRPGSRVPLPHPFAVLHDQEHEHADQHCRADEAVLDAPTQPKACSSEKTNTVRRSPQPASSKWWWIGDIRNRRRLKVRTQTTCSITLATSITHTQAHSPRNSHQPLARNRPATSAPTVS